MPRLKFLSLLVGIASVVAVQSTGQSFTVRPWESEIDLIAMNILEGGEGNWSDRYLITREVVETHAWLSKILHDVDVSVRQINPIDSFTFTKGVILFVGDISSISEDPFASNFLWGGATRRPDVESETLAAYTEASRDILIADYGYSDLNRIVLFLDPADCGEGQVASVYVRAAAIASIRISFDESAWPYLSTLNTAMDACVNPAEVEFIEIEPLVNAYFNAVVGWIYKE